jgi:hypothetical protein
MTYILGTNKIANKNYFKDENGCDICDKITYLGKSYIQHELYLLVLI